MPKRLHQRRVLQRARSARRIVSARSLRAAVVSLDRVLAEDVADADAQQLLVLEAVQDRVGIVGAAAQLGQLGAQLARPCAAG